MAVFYEFEAIGTHWRVDILDPEADARREKVLDRIMARIAVFDRDYSRFRKDSLVWKMSETAGTYELPADAAPMLGLYERAYRATGGAVTPLIGRALAEAGYDHAYSLVPGEMHSPPAWDDALAWHPPRTLEVRHPALLDFGAIGKGYLIDIVAALLADEGFRSYCVDAGGDMAYRNAARTPLRVGLEHPGDPGKVIGTVTLREHSLCGSAGNRRAWANFHHILDPRTLRSPRHLNAVWTTAESTILADAMTTCLYFAEPERLQAEFRFEYLLLKPDGKAEMSRGFPGELFIG